MKKLTFVLVLVLIMAFGLASVAYAITNGEPDGGRQPYVALLVFGSETPDGFVPYWRCSGALIAPDVVLTAGHCTDGTMGARVWFDEGPVTWGTWEPSLTNPTCAGETGYPCTGDAAGAPYTNPDYRSADNPYGGSNGLPAFSYRDVGVVVLSEPVSVDVVGEYVDLPVAGLVDTLKNKTDVDLVGLRSSGTKSWWRSTLLDGS